MRFSVLVFAASLAVLAACDASDPLASRPADGAPSRAAARAPWTPDDELARVARAEVPGFAGFWLRDDGTPVVRLVDPAQRGAAQRFLAPHLAAARRGRHAGAAPAPAPVFVGAAYDFARLKGWADALHPLLARIDVFMIDVDEVENRVLVGAADAAAVGAVRSEAARLGIPAAALEVRTQPRPEARDSLRGGVQIAFGASVCTFGFNATSVAGGQSLFVTSSHCTPTFFGFDGGTFYHPVAGAANVIGREIADRGLYPCNGPGTMCRKSDAAYVGHLPNASHPVARGSIARTAWASGGPGGTTVIGAFDIVARYTGFTPVGSWLDKTGRSTGSTYGQVTNSCVSFGTLVCQDVSKVYSQGGDSGAPVYVYLGGSGAAENDVQLHGILWGGPSGDPTTSYSSRLSGIEADLGALTNLCRPGYGC